MSRVRWAIVGGGWIARDFVAPAICESSNGNLVAVCDSDAASRDRFDVSGFDDLSTMLRDVDFEALYVATPNHLHAEQAIAGLRAGKQVLCEKPTALDAIQAEAMHAASEEAGGLLATAFDQRFHGAHRKLRELIAAGELGTVTTVRIRYACWTGRDWNPVPKLPHDNWRVDPDRAGGGAMIDLAPHGLDLSQVLLNESIEDVHCLLQRRIHTDIEVDDGGVIIGRTDAGTLIDLSVAYNCPETFPRRRLEVIGTEAMAVAINTMGQTPGGTLTFIDAADGSERDIDFSQDDRSPFLNQIQAFGDAVQGKTPWPYPIANDVCTMRLLDACKVGWASAHHPADDQADGGLKPTLRETRPCDPEADA